MPHREAPEFEPLSQLMRELGEHVHDRVRVGDVTDMFGARAIGGVLFLFGLLNLLPWPPGGTTITGAPLLIVAAQMAVGVRKLWLPRVITERALDGAAFRKGLARLLPLLERVERVSRPRLGFVFGPVGDRVLGVVCTLMAMIIVLPIFGGNFLPAVAVTILALSLVQRDGLLALVGYAVVAATAAVLVLVANVIIDGFVMAWDWVQARFAEPSRP